MLLRTSRTALLASAFFLLPLSLRSLPVEAGAADRAEVDRLSAELRDRVAESQWDAADDMYKKLVAVAGGRPSFEDHWRGYLAAQARGDAIAQAQRLAAAGEIERTAEVSRAEAALMAWYGRVLIKVSPKLEPRPELTMLEVPYEPDQRRVLEAASAAVAEDGRYAGLLPLGMYTLGATSFDIVGELEPVRVRVKR